MHSTRSPGVSALDVSPNAGLVLTGGRDKQVQVYDTTTDKIVATLKGHTKEVTRVAFAVPTISLEIGSESSSITTSPSFAISASVDSSVRIWKADETSGSYALSHTINEFKGAVNGLSVHPCAEFFAAAAMDGTWGLYDLSTGSRLLHGSADEKWTGLDIHPDGVLMALGSSSGSVHIIDLQNGQESAQFKSDAASGITSLHFSENGYYLATATSSLVEVRDLRKLNKAGTITVTEGGEPGKTAVDVRFDPSAQFLAVVGDDVRVYANKSWQLLWTDDSSNTAEISTSRWTWPKGDLVTASLDRTVRIFSAAAAEVEP